MSPSPLAVWLPTGSEHQRRHKSRRTTSKRTRRTLLRHAAARRLEPQGQARPRPPTPATRMAQGHVDGGSRAGSCMASTVFRMNALMRPRSRSACAGGGGRYSMAIFFSSIQPVNTPTHGQYATRGTFDGCCASAACQGDRSKPRLTRLPQMARGSRSTAREGSFLDHLLPALEVEMPHRAVEVDRRLFDAREEVVVQCPIVDGISHLHADLADERDDVRQRVHRAVHALADAVANGRRSEQRQDEIRTSRDTPEAERLTEVFLAGFEPGALPGGEQPADTEGAVEHKPGDFAQRAFPLPLEQAVDEPRHPRDIVDCVAEHDLHLLGHDRTVAAGDRLQRVLVHVVVEREHLLVERLPRI